MRNAIQTVIPLNATDEIQFLVDALVKRNQSALANKSRATFIAAGTTRLGKIEFVQTERSLNETLLIRIRQNQYSSAAMLETLDVERSSILRIHAEHEIKISRNYEIPLRTKRPRAISIGIPKITSTKPHWFIDEI